MLTEFYINLTYPILVDDVNNDGNFASTVTFADIDHTANLNKLGERLKQKKTS